LISNTTAVTKAESRRKPRTVVKVPSWTPGFNPIKGIDSKAGMPRVMAARM
jgi:hypothetical protein